MRCCVEPIIRTRNSRPFLWHLATLTCIRLKCHSDRPQAILLMRILLLIAFFILRFISFVVAASCSSRFKSECTAYTVIAAFSFISSLLVLIAEFVHFFRLWRYNPLDTRNGNSNSAVFSSTIDTIMKKHHRGHLGFVHHSVLNDDNAEGFGRSRCKNGHDCKSKSLHHFLFYHSLDAAHDIDLNSLPEEEKRSFIAFCHTSFKDAVEIAANGFPYGTNNDLQVKEYLRLSQNIFFTRASRAENQSSNETLICARLNLGRFKSVADDTNLNLSAYFGPRDGKYDTIYVSKTHRFYLRMPEQIEKWIIAVRSRVAVHDTIDANLYAPCV